MSWSMVGQPRVEKATKKLAQYFSEMEPAPNDRPLRESRVSFLKGQVEEEKFRTCEWASVACKQTGKVYRVNGKHTAVMLSSMNGSFPSGISIIVEKYEADTLEDVASLYSTFDSKVSARSQQDINRIFAASHPDLAKVSYSTIGKCVTGMSYATFGIASAKNSSQTQEQRAHLLLEHPGFVLWIHNLIGTGGKDSAFLYRGSVVAAMFSTFMKSHKGADEFWYAVKDGTGTKPSSPDRKLQRYLISTAVGFGRGTASGKQRDDQRAMYCKCIHAWNAWRKDGTTDLKYYASAKVPVAV